MWIINKIEVHAIEENTVLARIQDKYAYKNTPLQNVDFPRKYLCTTCLALCIILGQSTLPPSHFSDDKLEKIVEYLGKYDNILFKLDFDWNQKKQ